MRLFWLVCAVAVNFLAVSPVVRAEEPKHQEPVTIVLAVMSGKCTTLKVAGRDFRCRAIAFFQTDEGRANFVIALDDPADNSHIITFSGDKAKRDQDVYELSIDQMLLKSKDRPKLDGLPVPSVVPASGSCRQIGNFATQHVSSVACTATDANAVTYEFQFESDGSPIRVMMIRPYDPEPDERRAKAIAVHIDQIKCRQKADAQHVLPRDRTDFILQCMDE